MIDAATRISIRWRASNRCEYCRLHQDEERLSTFHIEHVIPKQHGGVDDPSNLALACVHCNLHKGPNLSAIDPQTRQIVTLFNPRRDLWTEHFTFVGAKVVGLTPAGRATVALFDMNEASRLKLRSVNH
jgi:hypothetical protein